ncbi:MAG: hypothetical protein O2981_00100 [Proteobacteria bacterium]|nr:hypothetical protein [Pseudomonadota bacterium]
MIQRVNGILLENSGDAIYSSTAVMLLTTLYGGVVSAVGYFFAGSGRPEPSPVKNHRRLVIGKWLFFANVGGFYWYAITSNGPYECDPDFFGRTLCGGYSWFSEPMAFVILACGVFLSIIKSKPGYYAANLCKSFLLSAMLSVTCGIIILFSGETLQGLSMAGVGLFWGLIGYIAVYIAAYSTAQREPINANLGNWHWMEVTAFYIFMFLAPDTILDNFQEADVQQQILQLENQVISLQEQLDDAGR